jgi:gamma-glutamyltranspeptidase / glutathione hydrolase
VTYTPKPLRLQSATSSPAHPWGLKLLFAAVILAPRATLAAAPPPLRTPHGAVASDHASASAAGIVLLRAGGNAVDAACATALALGVVNPHASGIGGGGFALIYMAKEKKTYALDFREQAPAAIRPDMFLREGKPARELSTRGGLAVGVPGEVRGLAELVRRWGKRSFADCVRPAERLARGFPIAERLARVMGPTRQGQDQDPDRQAAAQRFFKQVMVFKEPVRPGSIVRRPALGSTLRRLRQAGPQAFYTGRIAEQIVKAVKDAGGVLSLEDLRDYAVVERTPIEIAYRGHRVLSMPLPSSGGIVIAQVLGILSARLPDPSTIGRGSSSHLHLLAEALKHGFADRARLLGDADFAEIPVDKLLDPAYHRELAGRIDDRTVLPHERYGLGGGAKPPKDDQGTAHLSVIDAQGNAVALTTTINTWFGAYVVAGDTGIVLNNEMDDFSLAPNTPNAFGLVGSAQNAVAPGKRPLSSMSPTIVLDQDRVKMVVGGAGGPTIISGTLQVMLNVLDFNLDVQAASAAPRIHHQWRPEVLVYEPDVPRDVVEGLERRGHKTARRDSLTLVNAVVRTLEGVEAAAELRASGAPAGH